METMKMIFTSARRAWSWIEDRREERPGQMSFVDVWNEEGDEWHARITFYPGCV